MDQALVRLAAEIPEPDFALHALSGLDAATSTASPRRRRSNRWVSNRPAPAGLESPSCPRWFRRRGGLWRWCIGLVGASGTAGHGGFRRSRLGDEFRQIPYPDAAVVSPEKARRPSALHATLLTLSSWPSSTRRQARSPRPTAAPYCPGHRRGRTPIGDSTQRSQTVVRVAFEAPAGTPGLHIPQSHSFVRDAGEEHDVVATPGYALRRYSVWPSRTRRQRRESAVPQSYVLSREPEMARCLILLTLNAFDGLSSSVAVRTNAHIAPVRPDPTSRTSLSPSQLRESPLLLAVSTRHLDSGPYWSSKTIQAVPLLTSHSRTVLSFDQEKSAASIVRSTARS